MPELGRYPAGILLLAAGCLVLVARPATAQLQRQVTFDDGSSAQVRLMRDDTELAGRCPEGVYRFAIDRREDPAWTRSNMKGWDATAVFEAVARALRRSQEALPGRAPDVCIGIAARPTDVVLRLLGGIGGATVAPDLIALYVAPALNSELVDDLTVTIAHEYHHAIAWSAWPTGLDILIREGRANHFAWTLYPERPHPSAIALEPEQIAPAWERIRRALGTPAREFTGTYMLGGRYNGNVVPGWAGYTIGYCLARAYAEHHPELTAAELARISLREFLVEQPRCPENRSEGVAALLRSPRPRERP